MGNWRTALFLALWAAQSVAAQEESVDQVVIQRGLTHLRIDGPREWTSFPEHADGARLEVVFSARHNKTAATLCLRQQDVKQTWRLVLNGERLGDLERDENDMTTMRTIPAGLLADGDNRLLIEMSDATQPPDDIRAGEIRLLGRPVAEALGEARISLRVMDESTLHPVPARVTILDNSGALQPIGATSDLRHAVRTGTIYTADGQAGFSLPAGEYTVLAGRGFEYSVDRVAIHASRGDSITKTLAIRREVPTPGYVACDTHVHTLTYSGHGDATVEERMITLAGEGVELPVETDHNVAIDIDPFARRAGVRPYLTPVIGDEVTTRLGHFSAFPIIKDSRLPDLDRRDWSDLVGAIYTTPGVEVAVLNHARDVHSGSRPFGPAQYNPVVGENLDGWEMPFNAMEVINSGATQSDPLQLTQDWMTQLNRGRFITPIGSSDSHDVVRYVVGQGRTYIRCDDHDAGNIDVHAAMRSLVAGHVLVSYGLLADLTVNGAFHAGDLAATPDAEVQITARVLGPEWVRADTVQLYANGRVIRESQIAAPADDALPPGVKWEGAWTIPRPAHDVHLELVASGPGIEDMFWRTAKPYQPAGPDWSPRVLGVSGAIWLDVDGDQQPTSAREYASRVFMAASPDLPRLVRELAPYDQAVAAQAAHLWQQSNSSLAAPEARAVWAAGTPAVRTGFEAYLTAWRDGQIARSQPASP